MAKDIRMMDEDTVRFHFHDLAIRWSGVRMKGAEHGKGKPTLPDRIGSNTPTKTGAHPRSNPFRLALAVVAASSALDRLVNAQTSIPLPTEPVIDILERQLGVFLRPDWEQRGQADEGNDSQAGQEELAAQIRRRA
jgi:hypothetical protein